jgi:outer membrane immunogenic protein
MDKKLAFVGGVSALLFAASSALAADMAVKAPPPMPAPVPYTWTGYYVGANGGYGQGIDPAATSGHSVTGNFPLVAATGRTHPDGGLGGVEAGYNWQIAPAWLVGVETDFQFSGIRDTQTCFVACNVALAPVGVRYSQFSLTDRLDWFGTVRARAGYISGPTLFYLTGGLAYGEVKRSANISGVGPFGPFSGAYGASSTTAGWTVGGGIETKVWGSAWTAKVEYLYVALGGDTANTLNEAYVSGNPGGVRTVNQSGLRENIVRAGLNYHF